MNRSAASPSKINVSKSKTPQIGTTSVKKISSSGIEVILSSLFSIIKQEKQSNFGSKNEKQKSIYITMETILSKYFVDNNKFDEAKFFQSDECDIDSEDFSKDLAVFSKILNEQIMPKVLEDNFQDAYNILTEQLIWRYIMIVRASPEAVFAQETSQPRTKYPYISQEEKLSFTEKSNNINKDLNIPVYPKKTVNRKKEPSNHDSTSSKHDEEANFDEDETTQVNPDEKIDENAIKSKQAAMSAKEGMKNLKLKNKSKEEALKSETDE